jgi:squalene-hopene/tetraprenyl-beta-curcumene cyclase
MFWQGKAGDDWSGTWMRRMTIGAVVLSAATAWAQPASAPAAAPPATSAPATGTMTLEQASRQAQERMARRVAQRTIEKGTKFLLAAQDAEGAWEAQTGPGITCLVLKALIQEPSIGPRHEAVQRGVAWVLKARHEDGGIYGAEGLLKNYESSVALSLLATLSDPAYAKPIAALQKFLKDLQWDEGEGKSTDDAYYGGAGYGTNKRPDLSNTQMMLEALRDSGLPSDDPTYKKALVFIQRCQMLGEYNDQAFAKGSAQGGFIYTPVNGGESKAGTEEFGGRTELRCYGSMTYAGFKSLLYAGLKKDDPRVTAAIDWMRRHWTLDYNPNMPAKQSEEGLYYYYHVLARALDASGAALVTDMSDTQHHWRIELLQQLQRRQRADGSWTNEADRWMEGLPALTTAYALLALETAFPPGK